MLPADGEYSKAQGYVWTRESFAVAKNKEGAKLEESPGYYVTAEQREAILLCLEKVLLVDRASAKVLPYSEIDRNKVGRRVSEHSVHETFIGRKWKDRQQRGDYYEKTACAAPEL